MVMAMVSHQHGRQMGCLGVEEKEEEAQYVPSSGAWWRRNEKAVSEAAEKHSGSVIKGLQNLLRETHLQKYD